MTAPTVPQTVTATQLEGGNVLLSWTVPASNGGSAITRYRVSAGVSICLGTGPTDRSLIWAPQGGVAPTSFTVEALNVDGASPVVSVSVAAPAPPPPPPPAGTSWWGWDPNSWTRPPLLPAFPWHDTTGVWIASERAALSTVSSLTTSSDGQQVQGLHITGDVNVQHLNTKFKRCWIEGRIYNNSSSGLSATGAGQPEFYHCDLGYPGAGTKGDTSRYACTFFRCNVFGHLDGLKAEGHGQVMQDNFIHDLRRQPDASQPGGISHNDGIQFISSGQTGNTTVKHNTIWCWSIDQVTAAETCTRSSGPHWTDLGTALNSTGDKAANGSGANGYQSSGIQVGDGQATSVVIRDNLFRGHAAWLCNFGGATNTTVDLINNQFSSDESQNKPLCVAGEVNLRTFTGNTYYNNGQPIPG